MIQFYAPEVETSLMLPAAESLHCCRVLRMREGDTLQLVDGKGGVYTCKLEDANPKGASVTICNKRIVSPHWGVRICIAIAPPKNMERLEWFLEKAVEIGIDEVVLLRCARSERKVVKTERLQKIMVSAMCQSLKSTLPVLTELVDFREFVERPRDGQKFLGYCDEAIGKRSLAAEYHPGSDVSIMIGPEGDFSPQEVEQAIKNGWQPATFGDSRLRTETAALFALSIVHVANSL